MSYARWSDDNMQSDVYIYESCAGYCVTVRQKHPINTHILGPSLEELVKDLLLNKGDHQAFDKARNERSERIERLQWTALPDVWAGKSFSVEEPEELWDLLMEMQCGGLWVPERAFRAAEEDIEWEHESKYKLRDASERHKEIVYER